MDSKQRVPAQNFDVPIPQVEGIVWGYYRGVDRRLVFRCVCDREVAESRDTERRRLSDGVRGNGVCFGLE